MPSVSTTADQSWLKGGEDSGAAEGGAEDVRYFIIFGPEVGYNIKENNLLNLETSLSWEFGETLYNRRLYEFLSDT
jgi:hypothetical protein